MSGWIQGFGKTVKALKGTIEEARDKYTLKQSAMEPKRDFSSTSLRPNQVELAINTEVIENNGVLSYETHILKGLILKAPDGSIVDNGVVKIRRYSRSRKEIITRSYSVEDILEEV